MSIGKFIRSDFTRFLIENSKYLTPYFDGKFGKLTVPFPDYSSALDNRKLLDMPLHKNQVPFFLMSQLWGECAKF